MSAVKHGPSRHKVVMLGNASTGKTSIVSRQCHIPFRKDMPPTIGVLQFRTALKVGGRTTYLDLWDTAGQERYQSVVPFYARHARCCVLVCSITDAASIDAIDR
jgi:Ras-related protein Rab-6A